jgi:crossover junction endodeoxyribonuclease RuvC
MTVTRQIICGIDPGYARLGWGIVAKERGRVIHLAHGCIETPKGVPDAQRLLRVADELDALLIQWQPTIVGVEQLFFAKNAKTAVQVGQARGVVLYCIARREAQVVEFTPMQVKQALTGYGSADKSQMQKMTKLLLGLPTVPKPDDAADALAVAIATAQVAR